MSCRSRAPYTCKARFSVPLPCAVPPVTTIPDTPTPENQRMLANEVGTGKTITYLSAVMLHIAELERREAEGEALQAYTTKEYIPTTTVVQEAFFSLDWNIDPQLGTILSSPTPPTLSTLKPLTEFSYHDEKAFARNVQFMCPVESHGRLLLGHCHRTLTPTIAAGAKRAHERFSSM